MNEINQKILSLIVQKKSLCEISKTLNFSEEEITKRIRKLMTTGYLIKPEYYCNSDVYYNISKKNFYDDVKVNKELTLKSDGADFNIKIIVISDMHIGHVDSNIKLLYKVYDYAINNRISIIFNCGDCIEGIHTNDSKFLYTTETQMNYFIKEHPYDKSIINFILYGNHDYHSIQYDGLDISQYISRRRYDLVSLGYKCATINIKSEKIILKHKVSDILESPASKSKLVLVGHGHDFSIKQVNNSTTIKIPNLSKVSPQHKEIIPSFCEIEMSFRKGSIVDMHVKHLLVTDEPITLKEEYDCKVKSIVRKTRGY